MVCLQKLNLKKQVTKYRSKRLNYFLSKLSIYQFLRCKKGKNNSTPIKDTNTKINKKRLYKKLVKTYNPNRFVNSEDYEIAVVIFHDILKNKKNYNKLLEIEKQGISKIKKESLHS